MNQLMTTKTTKTILFASLIAALLAPFSTMDFAEAKVDTHDDQTSRELVLPGGHIVTEDNIIRKTVNSEGKVTTESGKELPSKYFIIDDGNVVLNLDVVEAEVKKTSGDLFQDIYNQFVQIVKLLKHHIT